MREITNDMAPEPFRWTGEGLLALQEAAEDFIVHLLEDCNLCAIHAKRVTISECTAWRGGAAPACGSKLVGSAVAGASLSLHRSLGQGLRCSCGGGLDANIRVR